MEGKDPFVATRKKYDSLKEKYDKLIVSAFDADDFRRYNEILFSAHSCGIEGNSFSVDDTRELKEKGYAVNLVNKTLLEAFEIMDHFNAYDYILKNKGSDFNESFVRTVHKILTKNTLPYKGHKPGEYAKTQMAAGDTVFRDTKKAIANMPRLLASFDDAIKNKKTHPLELSAIFHKMFIYSHPFPDGNGRLGRLLSNFILEKFKHPHIIILKEDRQEYIDALKASEKHNNMLAIVNFFYDTSIKRMQNEIGQKKNLSKNFNLGFEDGNKRKKGFTGPKR
ncbi:Fic family protein [Flagellimonas oceani]|uniref:Fic family protein n=1 Tax=Flagellimonas oceani TaxID=2698672 RepID=A0A6G7J3A3_9FLAO|nr:Fic family protein [Allomuricauda oceani]MBW8243381.1 Fic family protein [Allomuricauda oceani]MCR9225956.1 Fic family protein [Flavobacteriaceae bacterium]QII45353.1 Fic family protein [Allomuricauda oceani]|tara:strand:+ start:446 stop:1285 length:840 start_codon:yes stop_codon:yes gene_type:complete